MKTSDLCKEQGHDWQPPKPFATQNKKGAEQMCCKCGWCGKQKWFTVEALKAWRESPRKKKRVK